MVDRWIRKLNDEKFLTEEELLYLCTKVKSLLIEENNIQVVNAPVIICGNIRGCIYDLQEIFKTCGSIPENNYIFLGGYIDFIVNSTIYRVNSLLTISLLLALKVKYPANITLLRGKNETRSMSNYFSDYYGLYQESIKVYGNPNAWSYLNDVFDYFNIAALIENKVFCVHGGFSPEITTLDQIRTIERNIEITDDGPLVDLIWSCPGDIETWEMSPSGHGWYFGYKVVDQFNFINEIFFGCCTSVYPCDAYDGYKICFPSKNFASVWGCTNFKDRMENRAAVMCVDEGLEVNFKQISKSKKRALKNNAGCL